MYYCTLLPSILFLIPFPSFFINMFLYSFLTNHHSNSSIILYIYPSSIHIYLFVLHLSTLFSPRHFTMYRYSLIPCLFLQFLFLSLTLKLHRHNPCDFSCFHLLIFSFFSLSYLIFTLLLLLLLLLTAIELSLGGSSP
jgi:hypothetical protein